MATSLASPLHQRCHSRPPSSQAAAAAPLARLQQWRQQVTLRGVLPSRTHLLRLPNPLFRDLSASQALQGQLVLTSLLVSRSCRRGRLHRRCRVKARGEGCRQGQGRSRLIRAASLPPREEQQQSQAIHTSALRHLPQLLLPLHRRQCLAEMQLRLGPGQLLLRSVMRCHPACKWLCRLCLCQDRWARLLVELPLGLRWLAASGTQRSNMQQWLQDLEVLRLADLEGQLVRRFSLFLPSWPRRAAHRCKRRCSSPLLCCRARATGSAATHWLVMQASSVLELVRSMPWVTLAAALPPRLACTCRCPFPCQRRRRQLSFRAWTRSWPSTLRCGLSWGLWTQLSLRSWRISKLSTRICGACMTMPLLVLLRLALAVVVRVVVVLVVALQKRALEQAAPQLVEVLLLRLLLLLWLHWSLALPLTRPPGALSLCPQRLQTSSTNKCNTLGWRRCAPLGMRSRSAPAGRMTFELLRWHPLLPLLSALRSVVAVAQREMVTDRAGRAGREDRAVTARVNSLEALAAAPPVRLAAHQATVVLSRVAAAAAVAGLAVASGQAVYLAKTHCRRLSPSWRSMQRPLLQAPLLLVCLRLLELGLVGLPADDPARRPSLLDHRARAAGPAATAVVAPLQP